MVLAYVFARLPACVQRVVTAPLRAASAWLRRMAGGGARGVEPPPPSPSREAADPAPPRAAPVAAVAPPAAPPQPAVPLPAAVDERWRAVARAAAADALARFAHKQLTEARWVELCHGIVGAAGGKFAAPEAKARDLAGKLTEFLPCVPEHGSFYGEEDEDGVDRGGAARMGCLLPPSFYFDRATGTSRRNTSSCEPAPYLEDLVRDWDLVAYLAAPPDRRAAAADHLPSAADEDWWAYAVLAAHGLCPAD